METRICKTCGAEKPLTVEFWRKKAQCRGGFEPNCRECLKITYGAYQKKWNDRNPDRRREYNRKSNAKKKYTDRREYLLAYFAKWRKKNRSKVRQYRQRYYAKHKDQILARNRLAYMLKNKKSNPHEDAKE